MIPCILLKTYYSKVSKRYVNYCHSKDAYIHTGVCETCDRYDPDPFIEVDPDDIDNKIKDISPPDDEYHEKGKTVRTLASDNINKKLNQTDLEKILQSFRSPKGKGGGKHGKRKRKRYDKKEDY